MKPIEIALLFVGTPTLALEHFGESLNIRLKPLNMHIDRLVADISAQVVFTAPGMRLSVHIHDAPLAAQSFNGALDSPNSHPFRGILSDALYRHSRHLLVKVQPVENIGNSGETADPLTMLQLAHAAAILLAQWHLPAAVHWRQSNQLVAGSQYLRLADDATPWALLGHAKPRKSADPDDPIRTRGLMFSQAEDFIDRPILFRESARPIGEVHAAALSFMRHAMQTGAPVPDGHSFCGEGGNLVRVEYVAPDARNPKGRYDLIATDDKLPPDAADDQLLADHAVTTHVLVETEQAARLTLSTAHHQDQTRSLAISYLMLVIMPPVGGLLLASNLILGPSAWRTGIFALTSVGAAVAVAAFTFMNISSDNTAELFDKTPVTTTILSE